MQARGVSILRNAPNKAAATVWINWLLSKEGQETYVREWAKSNSGGAHSMRKDVMPDPKHMESLPDFDHIDRYSAISYDSGWTDVQRIIDLYNSIKS
jgi:ABC-type Fe3+ transport system substrate-binding protein